MNDVIIVENYVDGQCMRHVHLMSNLEIGRTILRPYGIMDCIQEQVTKEAGVWHVRAEWPYRGILDIQAKGWPKFRRVVVWNLEGCESMRHAITEAYKYFFLQAFYFRPAYVFMKKLPKGVENGHDFEDLLILETEWVPGRCVAVGGRTPPPTPPQISVNEQRAAEYLERGE